ncbi:MAG: hypothetical protein EOO20_15165 [Chryseobacterium sp.]|nr:MAG: hypothetical protein EOO20_15165 [Chryseobacterium sp.]
MAYLTIATANPIIKKMDIESLECIAQELYSKDIFFFNRRERANLTGIKQLFENPDRFLEYYNPVEVVDTLKYVFPETQPAYHRDSTCEKLNSTFKNYLIPVPIQDKGSQEVEVFRKWFKQMNCAQMDVEKYIFSIQQRFLYVGKINPKSIEYANSGLSAMDNYSLVEMEAKIDELLLEFNEYFHSNAVVRDILHRFQKWTFLGFKDQPIQNNFTGISDADLKSLLRGVEEKWKKPVRDYLIEYFRIRFNPTLEFSGHLLNRLELRACSHCMTAS